MSASHPSRVLARRGFLQMLAAAAAWPVTAVAQTAAPSVNPPAPTPPAVPEHSGSEARLLTEVLRTRYPDRFTDAQWTSIVGDFDGDLASGKRLRAVKLANGDEPDFTFRP
jgi:hypothetical protein